jgi:hydrogenase maturation protein HypF
VTQDLIRLRIRCRGAVQGVGFRPTVHRIAMELGLSGSVTNDPEGTTTEVEGPTSTAHLFVERLHAELPPLARLDHIQVAEIPVTGASTFKVETSVEGRRSGALVPPDAALCNDCRHEMEDPADRRHRYPFTTCTNCGPRFSLVHHLPYDRPKTAMACFPLCAHCQREYTDPADRRFHAEPVCCARCGPRLWLADRHGTVLAKHGRTLPEVRTALLDGTVVAIKGLGGFQLACRADRQQPVETLRARKRRRSKPFAVMVRDLHVARSLAKLTTDDEALMTSPRSPVLLPPTRHLARLAEGVAPGIEDLGLLLPTTPLHVELFRDPKMPPLVMTSANLSEEPICRANREAVDRLAEIADLHLLHDRDVVRRVDDSVARSTPVGPVLVRRARGWVPEPLPLPAEAPEPILAVGGHLQVTACVVVGDQAFPSQHVGDLDSESARRFHREVIDGLEDFLEVEPGVVVADAHPDYPSTWLANEIVERRHGRSLLIQHHVAHAAAVLAEHRRFPIPGQQVLAISLDGTGWGPDGSAWGGEWLSLDGDLRWRRLGHLEPLPLVGGERAVKEPWRVAAAALAMADAAELLTRLPIASVVDPDRLLEAARLAHSGGWPLASGAGRLFEAAGALIGLVDTNDWEGEAAVRLESLAAGADRTERWTEVEIDDSGDLPQLPSSRLLAAAARRLVAGEPSDRIAASLHTTFCDLALDLLQRVAPHATGVVALGGGCMVNRLLIAGLGDRLRSAGFEPLIPTQVPPGDGGLSYGQAVLAAVGEARGLSLDFKSGSYASL